MSIKHIGLIGVILVCVGCDRDDSEQRQLRQALQTAKAALETKLIDPYSARYERLQFHRDIGGITLCGTVNAKNKFGGYTGGNLFYAHVRDADESKSTVILATDGATEELVSGFCSAQEMQALPQLNQ